jgi:hypothetical protein
MGRPFLFREARFFEQDYAGEATPWSPMRRRKPCSICHFDLGRQWIAQTSKSHRL